VTSPTASNGEGITARDAARRVFLGQEAIGEADGVALASGVGVRAGVRVRVRRERRAARGSACMGEGMSEGTLVGALLDGRWRVESVIGGGHAGGVVYRGRDLETSSPVVVRCPAVPSGLSTGALDAALDAFVAEAELLARIGQATTDVERLLASGVELTEAGRAPFCVFEWLAGRSLERDLAGRAGGSSIGEALVILEPAARALAAAHAIGGAHKDVRPANLWLAEVDGRTRMKVAAFGLATRAGEGPSAFAPEYAAPEHFKSSYGAVGPQTDVYGLALTIVEMIAGRRALEGAGEADLFLATSDLGKRPTLRARGAQVSDALESVIARALAVDPRRRWANARELWDALLLAVPELTPAPPSVDPRLPGDARLASSPPGLAGPASPFPSARMQSVAGPGSARPGADAPAPAPATATASGAPGGASPGSVAPAGSPAGAASPAGASARGTAADRTGAWAWLVVVALGVVAAVVVAAKIGSGSPEPGAASGSQPFSSPPFSSSPPSSASASPSSAPLSASPPAPAPPSSVGASVGDSAEAAAEAGAAASDAGED
jgi:serine/threonine-protein kinase